jgi:cobalamin biosynthesis Mg chelatase CobN
MERYGEMATDAKNTRPLDEPVRADTTPSPLVTPSGVNGVAVYDQGSDAATKTSDSMRQDPAPVETRSGGSMIAWIIGIIILVLLVYFLWQFVF